MNIQLNVLWYVLKVTLADMRSEKFKKKKKKIKK